MEKNARVFDGGGTDDLKLSDSGSSLLFGWLSHLPLFGKMGFSDLLWGRDDFVFS